MKLIFDCQYSTCFSIPYIQNIKIPLHLTTCKFNCTFFFFFALLLPSEILNHNNPLNTFFFSFIICIPALVYFQLTVICYVLTNSSLRYCFSGFHAFLNTYTVWGKLYITIISVMKKKTCTAVFPIFKC